MTRRQTQIEEEKREVIERLTALARVRDPEHAHSEADTLLTRFLCSIGHADVAEAYDKINKWYS